MSKPFSRMLAIFAAVSQFMQNGASRANAMSLAGAQHYESRGHGKGGVVHSKTGVKQHQRAQKKKANVKRHRAACKG